MTLLAMPYVLDPDGGKFICETHGNRHTITCRCHPVSQRPVVDDSVSSGRNRTGTTIRLESRPNEDDSECSCLLGYDSDYLVEMVRRVRHLQSAPDHRRRAVR